MRKFFRKGPLQRIEIARKKIALGCMLEIGGYEHDEVNLIVGLGFRIAYMTLRIKIKYRRKSWHMGILIEEECIKIGRMRSEDFLEGTPHKYIFYRSLIEDIFGKPIHTKEDIKKREGYILLPKYPDYKEVEKIDYTVTRENRSNKQGILPIKKRQRTEINIPQGIPHPGKGSTSYNQGDDATFSISTGGHLSRAEVQKLLAGEAYYYRTHYPL